MQTHLPYFSLFFGGDGSQPGRNLHIFVPNLCSNLGVKSALKAKTCALKYPARNSGDDKIKMASLCRECGSLVKSLLKRLGISTLELKIHKIKRMDLRAQAIQRNEEKGSPIKVHNRSSLDILPNFNLFNN